MAGASLRLRLAAGTCLLAALAAHDAFPKDAGREAYAKDVEFLLDTLEKKAGHFFKAKGVDWAAVGKEFRAAVKSVKDDVEFVRLATRLVARLRDGHASLTDVKVQMPDEAKGRRFGGPGVFLLPAGDKVYVRTAWGPAERAGVHAGEQVVKIDGRPAKDWLAATIARMRDDRGFSTDQQALHAACHWGLGDWDGTRIELDLLDGRKAHDVTLTREGGVATFPAGPLFPPKDLKSIGRQSHGRTAGGFGYVHLRDVPQDLPDQLDTILEAIGDVPGLVLDMRANGGGGCDHDAVFGRFVESGATWQQYKGQGNRPYAGPMVVIVDAGVRSAGETVAGMFKEDGRAYMIGDSATAGMSSQKETVAVPSGLFSVHFSVASNKRRFNGGRGIEGIGVPPHEVVPYDPADVAKGIDTQIERAERLLREGFPKGKVAYRPPDRR